MQDTVEKFYIDLVEDIHNMDRILAFGCHPDDVEFMCAGTLVMLAQKGYEIHIATMTGGEVGSPTETMQQIRARRVAEAKNAADLIGAKYHYAGGCDLEVEYNADYRRKATRIMREVDPLIVFTTPPMDYLADHEMTSLLVRNAAYIASVPLYDCGVPTKPTNRFPYLYYWNASALCDIFGRPLPVSTAVDISDVIDTKTEMLKCHKSQRDWLAYHNGWDEYVNNMLMCSEGDGQKTGTRYGEAYIQHLGNGHPKDNILKAIFEDKCVDIDNGR